MLDRYFAMTDDGDLVHVNDKYVPHAAVDIRALEDFDLELPAS